MMTVEWPTLFPGWNDGQSAAQFLSTDLRCHRAQLRFKALADFPCGKLYVVNIQYRFSSHRSSFVCMPNRDRPRPHPAGSDWTSFRPRLSPTPLPFSLPSAPRKPGHGTCTHEVTCHARHTRLSSYMVAPPGAVNCSSVGPQGHSNCF